MIRPLEYEEREKVRGFAVLDDDFDCMAGDLCFEVQEKVDREKTRESMARNRTGCLDPMAWVYAVQTMVRRRR
jgi:hypothetical protein